MDFNILFDLLSLKGISNYENLIKNYFVKNINKKGFKVYEDSKGSYFLYKKSKNKNAKKLVIAAHFDEVGFVVRKINDNGTLSLLPVGGINPNVMLNQELVLINDKNKEFNGILGGSSFHLNKNKGDSQFQIRDLSLDLGFDSKDEVLKYDISPGNEVSFPVNCKYNFNKEKIISKSIDNRVGVFTVLSLINSLNDIELDYDLYLGCNVQEEVGLRGARITSLNFKPDMFIAIDTSPVNDLEESDSPKLGQGILLRIYDPGTILNYKFKNYLEFFYTKNKIKYQNYFGKGGTDAIAYETQNEGAIVTSIVIPARYLHTNATICSVNDIKQLYNALYKLITNLTSEQIKKLGDK